MENKLFKNMKRTKKIKLSLKRKNPIGKHVIADFWFGKIIEDKEELKELLIEAAKKAANTPLKISIYKFNPYGLTAVLLLKESHIAFHSWPEFNYLAIDIFTCGKKSFPEKALNYLRKKLKPKKIKILKVERGIYGR